MLKRSTLSPNAEQLPNVCGREAAWPVGLHIPSQASPVALSPDEQRGSEDGENVALSLGDLLPNA